MAIKNKVVSNPKTGQDIRFIKTSKDTNGEILEMESTYHAHSKEPAAHYHPYQEEDFVVVSGELTVSIHGKLKVLRQGDRLNIPPNTVHAMWNRSENVTVVNWKVQPAMNTEFLLEMINGLARDGETNAEGMPGILQVALMVNNFTDEFRLSKPPFIIQKILFLILTPFAYLAGYKPVYRKYID